MKGNYNSTFYKCVEGRRIRHSPIETEKGYLLLDWSDSKSQRDIGECLVCSGKGCERTQENAKDNRCSCCWALEVECQCNGGMF